MSRLVTAGNVVIPGTITVTVNNSHITPLDDLRVILNITGAGAVTLDDGTDTTQRVEIMNKAATACNLTYKDVNGNITLQLAQNEGARFIWVGGFWKVTLSGLITGTDMYGNPISVLSEATVETAPYYPGAYVAGVEKTTTVSTSYTTMYELILPVGVWLCVFEYRTDNHPSATTTTWVGFNSSLVGGAYGQGSATVIERYEITTDNTVVVAQTATNASGGYTWTSGNRRCYAVKIA